MSRTPRRPPGGAGLMHFNYRSTGRGLRHPETGSATPRQPPRRKTLAELLTDPEESERLTRETAWAERIAPFGDEAG